MPFPTSHYLLQFGGDLAPDEIWSNNIRLAALGAVVQNMSPAQEATALTNIKTYLTTWMNNSNSGFSTRAKLRYVKLNLVDTDGRYFNAEGTTAAYYDTAPYVTGVGNSPFPNATAMVLSWATAALRGRASKGRIYLPAPNAAVLPDSGRWTNSQVLSAGIAAKTFLNSLKTEPGLLSISAVPVVGSKLGAGEFRAITAVKVGDVPDTMRSRRNSQREAYAVSAL